MTATVFTAFLHKEWRSQRALLVGFVAMAFACLGLGFLFAPTGWLDGANKRAALVATFVMAGIAGGIVVAAPQTVRGELGPKEDHFLRRLPGALRPAFAAKAWLLLLAATLLPLLGVLGGELWLWARGLPMAPLDEVLSMDTGLSLLLPGYVVAVPLTFACAFWMPGARMAAGAALVIALALGSGVMGITSLLPGLDRTLGSPWHAPVFALVAFAAAYVGCVHGRRGGGHDRSATLGSATLIVGLLPHTLWFGNLVQHYRHPDPAAFCKVRTHGVSPDARVAVVTASEREEWYGATFRIDLATGEAVEVMAAPSTAEAADLLLPTMWCADRQRRHWLLAANGGDHAMLDLVTGAKTRLVYDDMRHLQLPEALRPALVAERRATSRMRQPGGLRAWVETGLVHLEERDGSVTRLPWNGPNQSVVEAGHGINASTDSDHCVHFDLVHRRFVALPPADLLSAIAVNGTWMCRNGKDREWLAVDGATDARRAVPQLHHKDTVHGLLDDATVLVVTGDQERTLAAFRPATGEWLPIALPAGLPASREIHDPNGLPAAKHPTFGPRLMQVRDLQKSAPGRARSLLLVIDPTTLTARIAMTSDDEALTVLAFLDDTTCLVDEGHRRLVRIDLANGQRTVLLPRATMR